jgi:3-hydroxyisobutyryl-CoA hydrolase
MIDRTIEEFSSERQPDEPPPPFIGAKRAALDMAFRHDSVEKIIEELKTLSNSTDVAVSGWAAETLTALQLRSPTSLKVALSAIRRGKTMNLLEALQMELEIATAYCVGNLLVFRELPNELESSLEQCKS